MSRKPFVPASEQLAAVIEMQGGSLNPAIDGRLIRISGGDAQWDIAKEWRGREITGYVVRKSLWDKSARINFHVDMTSSTGKLPIFSLQLKLPLTDEELHTAAETYMTLLNMARRD